MKIHVLILIFCLLYIFCQNYTENYTNMNTQIYEMNAGVPNKPDDTQFYACRQEVESTLGYPFKRFPNSNYRVKRNQVSLPLNGTFSAFLDVNDIRRYDHFYHAPICEDDPGKESYDFNTEIDSQFRLIPGAFPEEDINVIYEIEKEKDSHDLRNPYYSYSDPKNIERNILHKPELQDLFLRVKGELPKRHEDDRHLEGVEHAYGEDHHPM
jgi:hypothetical protein